jgi:hypothetical protein
MGSVCLADEVETSLDVPHDAKPHHLLCLTSHVEEKDLGRMRAAQPKHCGHVTYAPFPIKFTSQQATNR